MGSPRSVATSLHENPLGGTVYVLSQPHRHDAQTLGLRWPRLLAVYQTSVPRPFSLVADRYHSSVTLSAWELTILLGNGHPDRAQLAPDWRPVRYEGTRAAS